MGLPGLAGLSVLQHLKLSFVQNLYCAVPRLHSSLLYQLLHGPADGDAAHANGLADALVRTRHGVVLASG